MEVKEGKCWLVDYNCPCRTAMCNVFLPDKDCYVYKWFKTTVGDNGNEI